MGELPSDSSVDASSEVNLKTAARFYDALAQFNKTVLLEILHQQFSATLSAGLPEGLGGEYDSAEAMIEQGWTRASQSFAIKPVAERFLPSGDNEIVVLGRYLGRSRATGKKFDSAFAHILRFRDGHIDRLTQITDTNIFAEALRR